MSILDDVAVGALEVAKRAVFVQFGDDYGGEYVSNDANLTAKSALIAGVAQGLLALAARHDDVLSGLTSAGNRVTEG